MPEDNKNKFICWECEARVEHIEHHHPVPRSRGGKKTIPLCSSCHSKAHHRGKNMNIGKLTREGLAKAKARGVKLGNPSPKQAARLAHAANKSKANKYALRLAPVIDKCISMGLTTDTQISRYLNATEQPTQRGKLWTSTGVKNIRIRLDKLNK